MRLLRVRSARTPYRRASIDFGNLPLVLGPEHFEQGVAALQQLAKLVSDPILTVKVSDDDEPDLFRDLTDHEREAIVEAAAAAAEHDDPEAAEAAAEAIFVAFVGERERPVDPKELARAEKLAAKLAAEKAQEDRVAAEKLAADAKAEEDRVAAEKLAADAKAEEDRVAAEKLAADAKAEEDRVAAEKLAADAKAEEDRVAAEKLAADKKTAEETSKGDPAPAPVKTAAVAKPGDSSGRKPKAGGSTSATKAAKG